MFSGRVSGALALPITSRIAMRNPSVSEVSNPAPCGGGWTTSGFTFQYSALPSDAGRWQTDRRGQILAKAPAVRRAVVVDHAHLIVAKSVNAIFVKEEFGVLDEEIAHLRFAEIETPARRRARGR